MKLYLLKFEVEYMGYSIIGIVDDEEVAKEYCKKANKVHAKASDESITYEEIELNEIREEYRVD